MHEKRLQLVSTQWKRFALSLTVTYFSIYRLDFLTEHISCKMAGVYVCVWTSARECMHVCVRVCVSVAKLLTLGTLQQRLLLSGTENNKLITL